MSPKPSLRSIFALFGSSLLAMSSANAATYYWDGTSATWNDVANWSTVIGATTPDPVVLPLVADDLIFNITGANSLQNIALDANQAARSLTFNTTGATNFRANSSGTDARILTLGAGGVTLAATAGPVTIGESPATYGAVNITLDANQTWANSSSSLLTVNSNIDLNGKTLTMGANQHISGNITGTGTLTLSNLTTRRIFSGTNSFTSNLTIQSAGSSNVATLAVTSILDSTENSSLGKNNTITLGGGSASPGRLEYIGTATSSSNRTFIIGGTGNASAQIHNNGTGVLTFTATNLLSVAAGTRNFILGGNNTGNNEIQGGINNGSGVVNLSKTGAGKWILSGTNSYTGTTTVSGGELVLSGANSFSGTTTVSGTGKLVLSGANTPGASATVISGGGELVLDYTSQNNAKIGTGALSLSGGTVTLTAGSHAQTVASTSLGGAGTFITRTSGTSSLNLGAFTITRGGSLSISADNVATTDRTNTNGILGGNFVVGNNWAVNSTNLAGGAIVGLSSYTALPTSGFSGTTNYSLTGSQTLTGTGTVNSLKIIASADGQTLDINTRNLLVTNIGNSAGYLFTANDDSYTYNITGTAFLRTATANQDTFFFVNNGTLNMTADTGSGTGAVVKAGSGTLILGGDSSTGANWGGALAVQQGALRLTHNNGAGQSGGGVTVQKLAALELGNSVAIGAEALTITGTGVSNAGALRNVASNTSSYAGAITIGVDGARINSDSSGALTLSGGIVTAVDRNVTIGGAGNTTVQTAAISGAGGLIKDGEGTTTLSATNTYTGATTLSAGTLSVGVTANLGSSASNLVFNGGTLQITGTTLTNFSGIGHAVSFNASKTVGLDINNAVNTFTVDQALNQTSGGFTKLGAGTAILNQANTYTGTTTIAGGTLSLGTTGSLASSNIIVGASTTLDVSGVSGGFTLGANQTLSGTGTILGSTEVMGTLSPGNSPGTMLAGSQTWLNGGDYNWQMLDATGIAGTGFDTISITGILDLSNPGLTAGGFHINLWSLASIGPDVDGNALNFDNTLTQSWNLLSASDGITGFDANDFTIFTSENNGTGGFGNDLGGGVFSLNTSGNNLVLNFTAIPETSTTLLSGLGVLALLRRRRR